jgi:hypothetical protein
LMWVVFAGAVRPAGREELPHATTRPRTPPPALHIEPSRRERSLLVLRLKLIGLLPFLSRWLEATPTACCGTCPTCIGAAVTGLLLPMAAKPSRNDAPDS